MKDMSRAIRRHHAARLKLARRFYFGLDNRTDPARYGMLVHTSTLCSCWMCGNARPHFGPTLAERLHVVRLVEESQETPNSHAIDRLRVLQDYSRIQVVSVDGTDLVIFTLDRNG